MSGKSIPVPMYRNASIDKMDAVKLAPKSIAMEDVERLRDAYKERGDMGWRSATASPIAMLLDYAVSWHKYPGSFEWEDGFYCTLREFNEWRRELWMHSLSDLDDNRVPVSSCENDGSGEWTVFVSEEDMMKFSEEGKNYSLEQKVCAVFLCDQEAKRFLADKHYNYSKRATIYRMPARGSLASLIDLGAGLIEAAVRELSE